MVQFWRRYRCAVWLFVAGAFGCSSEPTVAGTAATAERNTLEQHVETARAHLARQRQVRTDSIAVVSAERVTWPSGAAGCPKPGMMYPQVLTAGYRIELSAGGHTYFYHGRRDDAPFYCEIKRRARSAVPAS